MSTFLAFNLPKPLHAALAAMNYIQPTPIQVQGIPVVMEGRDLVGIAQTGSGKTAAFGIPMIASLLKDPTMHALILVPTRELAAQIAEVLQDLTQNLPQIRGSVLIGGVSMHWQLKSLAKKSRIIIATPGRLLDHLQQRTVSLNNMKLVVLDEADRMLDIGFEPQLRRIFPHLPKKRQTLLFSATFPQAIERLAAQQLANPVRITIGQTEQPANRIHQTYVRTTSQDKNDVLVKELKEREGSVLIFARTKRRTDKLTKMLASTGFRADRIHGNRTQSQREKVMDAFRQKRIRILVATDIASRGIDVPHIAHVINYDLPEVPEDYIHRIGRTARAGAEGQALSLLTPEDGKQWRDLSKHLTKCVAAGVLQPMQQQARTTGSSLSPAKT